MRLWHHRSPAHDRRLCGSGVRLRGGRVLIITQRVPKHSARPTAPQRLEAPRTRLPGAPWKGVPACSRARGDCERPPLAQPAAALQLVRRTDRPMPTRLRPCAPLSEQQQQALLNDSGGAAQAHAQDACSERTNSRRARLCVRHAITNTRHDARFVWLHSLSQTCMRVYLRPRPRPCLTCKCRLDSVEFDCVRQGPRIRVTQPAPAE